MFLSCPDISAYFRPSASDQLGLAKVENNKIGSTTGGVRGISGGESKRLAFATEVCNSHFFV